MKTRHALIILILGFCISFVGAIFKILHLPGGDQILAVSISIEILGSALLLYKVLTHPKLKDFLDA